MIVTVAVTATEIDREEEVLVDDDVRRRFKAAGSSAFKSVAPTSRLADRPRFGLKRVVSWHLGYVGLAAATISLGSRRLHMPQPAHGRLFTPFRSFSSLSLPSYCLTPSLSASASRCFALPPRNVV